MKHPIATIINFCSNEARFLQACLEQASLFSKQIVVPVCDHFFDGTLENRALLEKIYQACPQGQFVEYPFIPSATLYRGSTKADQNHLMHSLSRLVGSAFLKDDIDTVLFLDADEVPDGNRFAEWLDTHDFQRYRAMRLANYWYFREPQFQATQWEDSPLLTHRKILSSSILLQKDERCGIYALSPGPKERNVSGIDGLPMFHHYSWVRTKEEMLKKVGAWGHSLDRDWCSLVEEEFSRPFIGIDFVHGYSYMQIEPPFSLLFDLTPKEALPVKRLSQKELLSLIPLSPFKRFCNWFS